MSCQSTYSPEDDALIMSAGTGGIIRSQVAERLGRTEGAINARRKTIMGRNAGRDKRPPAKYHRGVPYKVRVKPEVAQRFARPDWFTEDLGLLLKMK